jgi:hypothetical protein
LSHGTCSCILMYINAVADGGMLCLQHEFSNIIFKIKHILYTATRLAPATPPPPQRKILGARLLIFTLQPLYSVGRASVPSGYEAKRTRMKSIAKLQKSGTG